MAPGIEAAADGRVDRAGHVTTQDDALSGAVHFRIGNRHGGQSNGANTDQERCELG